MSNDDPEPTDSEPDEEAADRPLTTDAHEGEPAFILRCLSCGFEQGGPDGAAIVYVCPECGGTTWESVKNPRRGEG